MIELEGRVLAGLDEFMLRVGHLSLVCRVAHEVGGSWPRIQRALISLLESLVPVEPARNEEIARYLSIKKLCATIPSPSTSEGAQEYRYPNLVVTVAGDHYVLAERNNQEIKVGWQDRNLASTAVRSRVGAITWSGKSGSKTGLSHVWDWAQFLGLVGSGGQVSPIGKLLIALSNAITIPFQDWNPYKLGAERLLIAHQYFRNDVDLFAYFAPRLLQTKSPLTKSVCRELFVEALKDVVAFAERSGRISSRLRYELWQQWRDLERSADRSHRRVGEISTAWHRTASRVELLTDIGLLEKGTESEVEKYQYTYHVNARLQCAAHTLADSSSGDDWIDRWLVDVILAPSQSENYSGVIQPDMLIQLLGAVVKMLNLASTVYPIDGLTLGVAILLAEDGRYASLTQIRQAIEKLAETNSELARLSRGREGTRAEFISLNSIALFAN